MAMSSSVNVWNNPGVAQTINKINGSQGRIANYSLMLASGKRINKAGDNASGLAIAKSMEEASRAFAAAKENASNGVSLIQTAEGAMSQVHDILQRMRELTVQAANDTNVVADRAKIQNEINALVSEIDRIAATAEFNTKSLLSAATTTDIQVGNGVTASDKITISIGQLDTPTLAINTLFVDSFANSQTAMTALKTAIDAVSTQRSNLGATQNRLEYTIQNLVVFKENIDNSRSRIEDTDVTETVSKLSAEQILSQAASMGLRASLNARTQSAASALQLLNQ